MVNNNDFDPMWDTNCPFIEKSDEDLYLFNILY